MGTSVLSIDEAALNAAGYKFVDDTDPDILYGWPYNLYTRAASESAYGGNVIFSMGQVSATITYAFSGTYLAVVFAETYWAAEVVVTIDDTEYGSFTPHNASVEKETPGDSKVIFVKDDLAEGDHVVTITHKTAYTSGEDNVKADGTAYYDNDAFFDCLIVENQNRVIPDEVTVNTKMNYYSDEMLADWGLKAIPMMIQPFNMLGRMTLGFVSTVPVPTAKMQFQMSVRYPQASHMISKAHIWQRHSEKYIMHAQLLSRLTERRSEKLRLIPLSKQKTVPYLPRVK